jgi:hypothetical protein
MDELNQVMLFVNGLSSNTSLYVRSKHPQTVEAAIREATTYDNVIRGGARNFLPGGLNPPNSNFNTDTKNFFTCFRKFSGWAEPTPGAATKCNGNW